MAGNKNTTNINSFAQNMNRTVEQQANQLAMLRAMQESMYSQDAYVDFEYTDDNGTTMTYQIPSYDSVIRRLQAVEETLGSIQEGKGIISLEDGTKRTLKLTSVPRTPDRITGLEDPSTFSVDSNWFFEELMFPGARVSIDLTDLVEDTADRVRVTRIILSAENIDAQTLWDNDLSQNTYDYVTLKNVLTQNGVPYYEDEETVEFPLVSNQSSGYFQVNKDPEIRDGNVWYYLDSINYSSISSDGVDQGQNNVLSIGDRLSYQDSIFEILEIDQTNMKVRFRRISGVQSPGMYSMLNYYNDPFRKKEVKIRFGAHEMNIIYFKGISENSNLLGDTWSTPVKFSSDELILEGTQGLQTTPFSQYYNQYIVDWGSEMIANYRDQKIPAYQGHTPNTPVLSGSDFRVVQINTQINAAIDTTDVKNTASEIQSVKSQISSLKQTIASQKSEAQGISEPNAYNALQQQIQTNVNDLNNLQTTYSTLVSSFQSIVRENSAVTTEPKYHIRGFFPIPDFKYRDESLTIPEEIIGFDIAYRYIKEDSTATQLNTFTYTATDGTEYTGTFTDWVIEQSPMKTKILDNATGKYVWKAENIADGTETNINQIDIAISKGEKVEIKIRSISECGYPYNPLRSDWSDSIIMDFPPTLATGNQIADLIEEVNSDSQTLTVQNILDSQGVSAHLSDSIANKNSVNGLYFKHIAENIAYEYKSVDSSNNITINSISVQERLDKISEEIAAIASPLDANTEAISKIKELLDSKITQYDEDITNLQTGLADTEKTLNDVSYGLRQVMTLNTDDGGKTHPVLKAEKFTLLTKEGVETTYMTLVDGNPNDVWFIKGNDNAKEATVHIGDAVIELESNNQSSSDTTSDECSCDSVIQNKQKIFLYDTLKGLDNGHIQNRNDIDAILVDVNTKASNSSLDDVSNRLANVAASAANSSSLLAEMYDHDTRSLSAAQHYMLDATNTQVARMVYSQSGVLFETNAETPVPLYVDNVNFKISGEYESLQEVYSNVMTCKTSIEDLQTKTSTADTKLNGIVTQDSGGFNLKGNNGSFSGGVTANTVTATNFKVSGNDEIFEPKTPSEKNVGAVFSSVSVKLSSGSSVELYQKIQELESTFQGYTQTIDMIADKITEGGVEADGGVFGELTVQTGLTLGTNNDIIISSAGNNLTVAASDSGGASSTVNSILNVGNVLFPTEDNKTSFLSQFSSSSAQFNKVNANDIQTTNFTIGGVLRVNDAIFGDSAINFIIQKLEERGKIPVSQE